MLDWSPKQISGWLETPVSGMMESMRVSHETIYRRTQSSFKPVVGAEKENCWTTCRSKALRVPRRSQHSRIFKDGRGQIPAGPLDPREASCGSDGGPCHSGSLGGVISCAGSGNSHIATSALGTPFALCHVPAIKVPSRDTKRRL